MATATKTTKKAEPKKPVVSKPVVDKKATTTKASASKAAPKPVPSKPKALEEKEAAKKKEAPKAASKSNGKIIYHITKRDNNGREWKVFIQGSDKVIKLFSTQKEALDYAKALNKDKDTTVMLHGLDGKIRKI